MKEFRVCAACGYGRGFHVFFRHKEGEMRIGLICPNCGQSYDTNWTVQNGEDFKPVKKAVYNQKE